MTDNRWLLPIMAGLALALAACGQSPAEQARQQAIQARQQAERAQADRAHAERCAAQGKRPVIERGEGSKAKRKKRYRVCR